LLALRNGGQSRLSIGYLKKRLGPIFVVALPIEKICKKLLFHSLIGYTATFKISLSNVLTCKDDDVFSSVFERRLNDYRGLALWHLLNV
jgi:hypothetical protein